MMVVSVFVTTFFLSVLAVWCIQQIAWRFGWIAQPRHDRWHRKPTALYGGIGIVIAWMLSTSLLIFKGAYTLTPLLVAILLGALMIFIVGLIDDWLNFKPSTKLIAEIITVTPMLVAGLLYPLTPWSTVNLLFTLFWLVAIINAINIIDNMDGLSSSVVMIALTTLIAMIVLTQGWDFTMPTVLLAATTLAAVAGFLLYNLPPASIFMGDSGSLFLGYLLAALSVPSDLNQLSNVASSILFVPLLPLAVLAIPIFDMLLVTIARLLHGRSPAQGGRDHSSHRLVGLGFSEPQAVMILSGLSIVAGIIATAFTLLPRLTIPLVILYGIFLVFTGLYLGKVKVYPEPEGSKQHLRWTPLTTQFLYKRHAAEVVLDVLIIVTSYLTAYILRFEHITSDPSLLAKFFESLPIVIASCLLGLFLAGVYRGIWHLITLADLRRYLNGVAWGVGISVVTIVVYFRFEGYSRAVFLIFGQLLFLLLVGSRLSFRLFDDIVHQQTKGHRATNIVVYGAGTAGKLLYNECSTNREYQHYAIRAFIDDDEAKQGLEVAGVTIYGAEAFIALLPSMDTVPIHELWISSTKIDLHRVASVWRVLGQAHAQPMLPKLRRFRINVDQLSSDEMLPPPSLLSS